MLAKAFHGEYPRRRECHPSWQQHVPNWPTRVVSCIDDDQSEPDIEHEVKKFGLTFMRMRKKALFNPVDPTLPGSHFFLKIEINDVDISGDSLFYFANYPVINSYLVQKHKIKGCDLVPAKMALQMKQCSFVFYQPHPSWTDIVKAQMDALAVMMMGTNHVNRPPRPAGVSNRDVGYMLYFNRQRFVQETIDSEPIAVGGWDGGYPNRELVITLLGREAAQLNGLNTEITRQYHFEMLRHMNILCTTNFAPAEEEEKKEEAEDEGRAKKKKAEGEEDGPCVCGVCYDGDIKPDIQCSDTRCDMTYHTACLNDVVATARLVACRPLDDEHRLIKCFYCTHWMVVPRPQMDVNLLINLVDV